MDSVKIEYLGHSCFRLSYAGQRIVLDPYADGSVPGLPPLHVDAEFVYCSHGHHDHGAVECVKLTKPGCAPSFSVTEVPSDHDHHGGARRGKNMIRVFDFGPLRVAHMGDIGRNLTLAEIKTLFGVDMLLIPVGGHYTIDAVEAKEMIAAVTPRVTVLMHFRDDTAGYDVLAHLDDVLKVLGPAETVGDTFTLTAETPEQTIIMKRK